MDISAYSDWRVHSLDVSFFHQYFPRFGAKLLDFLLCDSLSLPELLNLFVDRTHNLCYKGNYYTIQRASRIIHLFMSHIKELIQKIFDSQAELNLDSLKKLIYLAVNDSDSFCPFAQQIAELMSDALQNVEDDAIKLLVLQLLSEMATNYTEEISSDCYDFSQIISLLSDENAEVRKASHYLLLIFIKKYEKIDEILKGYVEKVKENPDHWKKIQKIIHSFQSLLVIQPKCVTYGQDYGNMDDFLKMLIGFRFHQHNLIQKASDQTVISFVKNQYVPQVMGKLDHKITDELTQIATKVNVNLGTKKMNSEEDEVQEIKIQKKVDRRKSQLDTLLEKLQNQSDWKIKSDMIEEIYKILQSQNKNVIPDELVDRVLDFTYDYNFKICITAMNIIYTLICNYPKDSAEKIKKIQDIIIDKICDLKMAVRQIASKILKKIFINGSKDSTKKVLHRLSNCSVVGKEQILNFLQDVYSCVAPTDLSLILGQISAQFSNQNTRIKIKALDCLVKICVNNNVDECKYILQKKLNKVYYDMFLERLKEKTLPVVEQKGDKWEDKGFNKGMTWQADRSAPVVETNDKFLTKVQFGRKNQKPVVQEEEIYDFQYQAPMKTKQFQKKKEESKYKFGTSSSSTSNCTTNTFDTIKSQDTAMVAPKKFNQNSKPSIFSNFESGEMDISLPVEEKKIPLKPNPVKKKPINNENVKQEEPMSGNLIIKSKQYQNKTNFQEIKQEKPSRTVRLNKTKVVEKIEQQEKYSERAKEPFSIKKSSSKKQHQIDYKATQYVSKQQLAPVDNPKQMLKQIALNLPKDNDWNKQFQSLDGLRRLIKNHQEIYPLIYQNLPSIMPQVLKLVDSLRSTLAKNGMITLSEMCEALKKAMDPFLQGIFVKLFRKAQDANTFIVEQVRKCMTSLCSYCTTQKISVIIINNSQAKAVPIKTKVALCIEKILQKQDYNIQVLKENPKIMGVMCNFITDGSAEVRNCTKQIFLELCSNNSLNQVEGVFKRSPRDVWEKWKSIIDKEAK